MMNGSRIVELRNQRQQKRGNQGKRESVKEIKEEDTFCASKAMSLLD
jgi:hypothetical protein